MPSRGLSRKGMASFLFFYLTRPLLLGDFRKSPQSPLWLRLSPSRSAMFKCICHCTRLIRTFPLKEGVHRFPLNPLSPQGTGDLTGKPAVLYSQTSARPFGVARDYLRNRVAII